MAENDIAALMEAVGDDFLLFTKITVGRQSVEETQMLIDKLGKVEIQIGDGLTLLHQAASHNDVDVVEFLCSKGHPLEVGHF